MTCAEFRAPTGQAVADSLTQGIGARVPLLGQIPLEPPVREWGDKGMPVVQSAPDTEAAKAFMAIAEELASKVARAHFDRAGGTRIPGAKGPTRLRIVR